MRVARPAFLAVAVFCCLAACGPRRPPPPAPLAAVVVLPIADAPDRSAVTGVFTFYSWIAEARAAVPAQLAGALRGAIARRGIAVQAAPATAPSSLQAAIDAAAGLDAPALYVELGKWEAENRTAPQFVNVALEATLIAPGSGKILWTSRHVAGPFATRSAIDLTSAYRIAADEVAEWLVGEWTK